MQLCHVLQYECRFKEAVEFMEACSSSWDSCLSFMYVCVMWWINVLKFYFFKWDLDAKKCCNYQAHTQLVACSSLLYGRSFSSWKNLRGIWPSYLEGVGKSWYFWTRGKFQVILTWPTDPALLKPGPNFYVKLGVLECHWVVFTGACSWPNGCIWGPSEDLSQTPDW